MQKLLSFLLTLAAWPLFAQTNLPSVQEVYKIFQGKCVSCHQGATPAGGLDLLGTGATELLRAQNVASKLTNINPTNAYALGKGYKRVYPGRADRSFLFRKINLGFEPTIGALHANEGDSMPKNYPNNALTAVEKEVIRQWILYGAKNTGTQFDRAIIETFYNVGGEKSFPNGQPPAPAPGEGFQVKMGPFFLGPGGEVEYFQKWEMNLPANVEVKKLEFLISPFSHHFLLYNFTGSGAATIPHGLRLNANHSQINLIAAVQEATTLDLPQTTAFKWDKNIVFDLNSHYINYSYVKHYECEAYINIYTQPLGTAKQEMFANLLINPIIPIPNNGNVITHTKSEFQIGADSVYIWGLMGHTHKYGRGYQVWKRLPNGQKGELIYDASCPMAVPGCPTPWFDYQHIPIRYWLPLLPVKWSNGIIHEAKWVNDGPNPVNFGPTSEDEMMVLIAFYTEKPILLDTKEAPVTNGAALRFWPNPSTGTVWFERPENTKSDGWLRVFDTAGREILRRDGLPTGTFPLELEELKPGLYFVEMDGTWGKLLR